MHVRGYVTRILQYLQQYVVCLYLFYSFFFFFKQKTAYEMRISDWSSDVCSSDLTALITSGGETGHVADHATTQGHHRGAAVMPRGQQAIENKLQGFPILEGFAVGQHHGNDRESRQIGRAHV